MAATAEKLVERSTDVEAENGKAERYAGARSERFR
jgi:hypothetical protein